MEMLVEKVAAAVLCMVGVSLLTSTPFWIAYYKRVVEMGHKGVRLNGTVSLVVGMTVILLHNVWSGVPVLLTLLGWLLVAESVICFLVPEMALTGFKSMKEEHQVRVYQGTGTALLALSILLVFHLIWI